MAIPFITAEEAASYINNNDIIACSGFTPAGTVKAVPLAISERALKEHAAGRPFKVGVITGASTGDSLDGAMARADALLFRTPYQTNKDLRASINAGKTEYFDSHLSTISPSIRYGFLGKIKWAIIEACDVNENGEIVLTTAVGISPTICQVADKIIIELNHYHPRELRGMHDIYVPLDPPFRREIRIFKPSDRIGTETIKVDPSKIVGIVETNLQDEARGFSKPDEVTEMIGKNVARFLSGEIKKGRMPASFLPIQSGVGNIANAVLGALGADKNIPAFEMYTEVIQDSVIGLMQEGRISFASACSLTVTHEMLQQVYDNLPFFHKRMVLRPQEISNNPGVARRLGVISINTALEADIFGNVNSSQVMGRKIMNGIGGSGDFTRNAYVSIFTSPSIAKGGNISTFVPMVTHTDHSEHSVHVIVTEQGIADLRAKSPKAKAEEIINNCVHPDYRGILRDYINQIGHESHTPLALASAFGMHLTYERTGDMRNVDWKSFNL